MTDRMYLLGEGTIEPLIEDSYESEDALQELVANHPSLLDGDQISPGNPRRWLLIRREMGIADSADSGNRWSVDHLFIDQDAIPTLVEVKQNSDTRIRREVVGQMLEYASHATRYWPIAQIRAEFEATASARGLDPAAELAQFLGTDGESEASEAFWQDVSDNLRAGRIRLLFVADLIPDELRNLVEFLNEQMTDVEVLAIELKQFRGEGLRTLVPRVFGRTSLPKRQQSRSTLTRSDFLEQFELHEVRALAERLLDVTVQAGGSYELGSTGVSLRVRCPLWPQPLSIAWIYPTSRGWAKTRDFSFGSGAIDYTDLPSQVGDALGDYIEVFRSDGISSDVSSVGVSAWALDPSQAVQFEERIVEQLESIIGRLRNLDLPDAENSPSTPN